MTASAPTREDSLVPENAWGGFVPGAWQDSIDVRDFILANFTPYTGDAAFLSGATEVHAHCLIGNDRSACLLAWLGFRPCGRTLLRSRPLRAEVPAEMLHLDRDTFQQRHAIALTTPADRAGPTAAVIGWSFCQAVR